MSQNTSAESSTTQADHFTDSKLPQQGDDPTNSNVGEFMGNGTEFTGNHCIQQPVFIDNETALNLAREYDNIYHWEKKHGTFSPEELKEFYAENYERYLWLKKYGPCMYTYYHSRRKSKDTEWEVPCVPPGSRIRFRPNITLEFKNRIAQKRNQKKPIETPKKEEKEEKVSPPPQKKQKRQESKKSKRVEDFLKKFYSFTPAEQKDIWDSIGKQRGWPEVEKKASNIKSEEKVKIPLIAVKLEEPGLSEVDNTSPTDNTKEDSDISITEEDEE